MLKHLRELHLFQKQDIVDLNLLRYSCNMSEMWRHENWGNTGIFHYLMEWDPTALNNLDTILRNNGVILLQELLIYGNYDHGMC